MVASRDELPADIFLGIKEQLTYDMNAFYPRITNGVASRGILIGTVSGTAGATHINFSDSLKYIERYAVVYITNGVVSETHQLDTNDETSFFFTSLYDGQTLVNTLSGASVYLTLPCEFGLSEKEILLPGISVWGMAPEEVNHATKIEVTQDTFSTDGSLQERLAPVNFKYQIGIACEARQNSILAIMSQVVRRFIAREYFWVNGKRINIRNPLASVYVEPAEGYNEIPKIQYSFEVEVREEVYDRTTDEPTTDVVITYNIGSAPLGPH
jgi:hypothetical protein